MNDIDDISMMINSGMYEGAELESLYDELDSLIAEECEEATIQIMTNQD